MKKFFLILLTTFSLSCCNKDDNTTQDQLPPITTTGANTAGCIINGKVILPKNGFDNLSGNTSYGLRTGAGINFHPPIIGDDYKFFEIMNLKDSGKSYSIYIHINDMSTSVGNYTVGQSNNLYFIDGPNNPQIIVRETINNISGKTFISGANSGTIIISKFDYLNGLYAGTFSCELYDIENPTQIIQVSDGRFDIDQTTLNH